MSAVKVYGPAYASAARRVLMCLVEKKVGFEIIPVDLRNGEQKQPEFIKRQPFGVVPAIQDGDLKLFESRAIIRYYAEKYANQGTNLLGNTPEEKATVDQWMEVEGQNYHPPLRNLLTQLLQFKRKGIPPDQKVVEESEGKMKQVLDLYEARLSESKYLAGDFFSLADLNTIPFNYFLESEVGQGHLLRERERVSAWWDDITSRPSWKKVLQL